MVHPDAAFMALSFIDHLMSQQLFPTIYELWIDIFFKLIDFLVKEVIDRKHKSCVSVILHSTWTMGCSSLSNVDCFARVRPSMTSSRSKHLHANTNTNTYPLLAVSSASVIIVFIIINNIISLKRQNVLFPNIS